MTDTQQTRTLESALTDARRALRLAGDDEAQTVLLKRAIRKLSRLVSWDAEVAGVHSDYAAAQAGRAYYCDLRSGGAVRAKP